MNSFKMAYKLLKNNLNMFTLYLVILIVSVATYYNFVSIQYNESFIQLNERINSTMVASYTCAFVLVCTVIFFVWSANQFFFKQRQKEVSLYMLMGISTSKIGKVFVIETFYLGTISFVIGLPLGILFSKLFFMLLTMSMSLDDGLVVDISLEPIINVILTFGLIFIVLAIKNYRSIKKNKLIDMLNLTKKKSKVPKLNAPKGFLGIFLIVLGYLFGVMIKRWQLDLLIDSMLVLILVSVGTYIFFESFLPIILNYFIQHKEIVYKKSRLVSVSSIFFRLKDNYSNYAMTAILAAATITALSVSLAFQQYAADNAIIESPYSFSYVSSEPENENINHRVEEYIKNSSHDLIGTNRIQLFFSNVEYRNLDELIDSNNEAIIISYSDIKRTLEFLDYKNFEKILQDINPMRNQASFIRSANTMSATVNVEGENIVINGNQYSIKYDQRVPVLGKSDLYGAKNIYVLHDEDYKNAVGNSNEMVFNGVQITNEENSDKFVSDIRNHFFPNNKENVIPHVDQYVWEYYALGTFSFLGFVMSIIFMFATFSALYFKMLSEAIADREQYLILKKIGMSRGEVKSSVSTQLGISFILPTILGAIHSIFAVIMVSEIMDDIFYLQLLFGFAIFVAFMILFYAVLRNKYIKIVYE